MNDQDRPTQHYAGDLALSRTFKIAAGSIQPLEDSDSSGVPGTQTYVDCVGTDSGRTALAIGTIIDCKYEVISLLGVGGMGAVYRVKHLQLDKEVALKTFATNKLSTDSWLRFQREAQSIAKLDCINIVQVFDFGIGEHNIPFYTMEYLQGESLADKIRRLGPLAPRQALVYFYAVAQGLLHAHRLKIVHRDLKPANIFACQANHSKRETVKLVDFGIAKLVTSNDIASQKLTNSGIVFGSPLYMSPEQSLGIPVDERSDLYSYGCSLFEVLTGVPPFVGQNAFATVQMHHYQEPPRLIDTLPEGQFDPNLESLVKRLLAKDASHRYQSCEEVIKEIELLLKQPFEHDSKTPSLQNTGTTPLLVDYSKPEITDQKNQIEGADSSEYENHKNAVWRRAGLLLLTLVFISTAAFIALNRQNAGHSTQTAKDKNTDNKTIPPPLTTPSPLLQAPPVSPSYYSNVSADGSKQFDFPNGLDLGMLTQATRGHEQRRQAKGRFNIAPGTLLYLDAGEQLAAKPELFAGFRFDDLSLLRLTANFDWTEKHIDQISRLTGLNTLDIAELDLHQSSFDKLNNLHALTCLNIPGCHTSAQDILKLKRLDQLQRFNADSVGNMNLVIKKLISSKEINDLSLQSCNLTDDSLKDIAQISGLKVLKAGRNEAITPAGIAHLSNMPKLSTLDLEGINLDPRFRKPLQRLQGLTFLKISIDSSWTDKDTAGLRAALPGCKIDLLVR